MKSFVVDAWTRRLERFTVIASLSHWLPWVMPSVLRTIWLIDQRCFARSYCYSGSLASCLQSLGGDGCPEVEIQWHDGLY